MSFKKKYQVWHWQLFDLTWSTDMEEFGSNGFFMMPPEEFLKSHYPSEEKWQLLD